MGEALNMNKEQAAWARASSLSGRQEDEIVLLKIELHRIRKRIDEILADSNMNDLEEIAEELEKERAHGTTKESA